MCMKYAGIRAFENYKDSKTSKNRRKSATGAKIGLLQLPGASAPGIRQEICRDLVPGEQLPGSGCGTRGAGWPSKILPGDPLPGSGTR